MSDSLLDYYRRNEFNPVPIPVEETAVWDDHFAKRLNLLSRHLHVPPALLRGARVLEFGCNSGENALVLAAAGAQLTLVEPNEQVLPRLRQLFDRFGLADRIHGLHAATIGEFEVEEPYDLVIAEGFLFALPDRDALLTRLCQSIIPGGLGIVSFNDRYGMLLEQTRRTLLRRACELQSIDDMHSAACLDTARALYGDDFARLNTSRSFEVWWKDTLVNPFLESRHLWSDPEVIGVAAETGCEVHASSPPWTRGESLRWYKNVADRRDRRDRLMDDWRAALPYFVTGLQPEESAATPLTEELAESIATLVAETSRYTEGTAEFGDLCFPQALAEELGQNRDARVGAVAAELAAVYASMAADEAFGLMETYGASKGLRSLWGAPYHYLTLLRST